MFLHIGFLKKKMVRKTETGRMLMVKPNIKVGSYYEIIWKKDQKIACAVMYGFKDGKNKDVYSLMLYTKEKVFEFPIHEQLFMKWVDEGRIREITSDEALACAL
jgi:hypothetical protein